MVEPVAESWRPYRRPENMDPQMKRVMMAAAGVTGAVVVLFGGYTLLGRGPRTVPVIEAPAGPVRVKPDNPGGMQVVGADEQIMGGDGASQADHMAPPPETPQPQALRAEIAAADAPTQPAAPATPPPVAAAPATAPTTASVPDTAAPAAAPALAPPPRHAAVAPTPAHAVPATTAPATVGGTQVQLAALDSQQAAMAEWDRLSKRMPDLFHPHQPQVQRADLGGKTFYRLRTSGFANIASATEFCAQVRSKGAGCSIASF